MDKNIYDILNNYKLLKIKLQDFKSLLVDNPLKLTIPNPIIVTNKDVLNAIEKFQDNRISIDELIYWADVMRLSGLYTYTDDIDQQERIATVIDMIEDVSMYNQTISYEDAEKMKKILID